MLIHALSRIFPTLPALTDCPLILIVGFFGCVIARPFPGCVRQAGCAEFARVAGRTTATARQLRHFSARSGLSICPTRECDLGF